MPLTQVPNSMLGGDAQYVGFRNRLINGDCRVDQRNNGASVTPTTDGQYTIDRWSARLSVTSKFSVQQNAGAVTPPAGFTNYLGVTSLSAYSVTASDFFGVVQPIEGFNSADLGWGTANAQAITFSFWARSSLTGTFGGAVSNAAATRAYPFTYTISSANTWTQIFVNIPGDTSGTWVGATNGIGLYVGFGLGAGSTYSGTAGAWGTTANRLFSATGGVSVVGTNAATFYVTGIDFRPGTFTQAPPWEFRSYAQEELFAKRYYWKWIPSNTDYIGVGNNLSSNLTYFTVTNPVIMRAAPTLTTSGTAADYKAFVGTTPVNCNAIPTINVSSKVTPLLNFSVATALTVGGAALCGASNTNAFLGFDAEL